MTETRVEMSEQGLGRPHLWAVWALLYYARSWFDCIPDYATFLTEFPFRD